MCRQRNGAEPPHHHGRGGKEPGFAQHCQANGPAQPRNAPQHLPIRAPEADKELVLRHDEQDIDDEAHHGGGLRDNRGDGRPHDPHLWRAPVAEDQRIVDQRVQHRCRHSDPEHHLRAFQRREVVFQHHHNDRGEHAPACNLEIGRPIARHILRLPQQAQDGLRKDHQRHRQHRIAKRQPQPHAGCAAN